MLYTIANDGWSAGSALPASSTRPGLYRTRSEAESVAGGHHLLAVALRYDATRGMLIPTGPHRGWSAPAIAGPSRVVTPLASIPAELIRLVEPARLRLDPGHPAPFGPHIVRK